MYTSTLRLTESTVRYLSSYSSFCFGTVAEFGQSACAFLQHAIFPTTTLLFTNTYLNNFPQIAMRYCTTTTAASSASLGPPILPRWFHTSPSEGRLVFELYNDVVS